MNKKYRGFWLKIQATCGSGLVAKSCLTLAIPWTVAQQAPPSMGFSRQKYRSGLPFPSPGDLPDPGIKPGSSALQEDSLPTELQGKIKLKLARKVQLDLPGKFYG